jgi:hypothetical protein
VWPPVAQLPLPITPEWRRKQAQSGERPNLADLERRGSLLHTKITGEKIGPYEYLYLVENAREGGRQVQRVIKALGRRDEVEKLRLLDGLINRCGLDRLIARHLALPEWQHLVLPLYFRKWWES